MNVSVLNVKPRESIDAQTSYNLTEGTTSPSWVLTSSTTKPRTTNSAFTWDSSHLDSDLDGDPTGDDDFTGGTWTINDLPPGEWTVIVLPRTTTVVRARSLTVVVAELPPSGLFESITSELGTTTTAVIGLLGIIIIGLAVFLFFTRQRTAPAEEFGMFEQSQFAEAPKPVASLPVSEPVAASVELIRSGSNPARR